MPVALGAGIATIGFALAVAGSGVFSEVQEQMLLEGFNPVTQPIGTGTDAHPANSGFLVFVENDVTLAANEAEGTIAAGGNLVIRANTYQVEAGSFPKQDTFTAPGDSGPTYLYVGKGVVWDNPNSEVRVENNGFTKIADTSTYSAFNRDSNNALVNYRVVKRGAKFESKPLIDGRTNAQTPDSIGTPVPRNLIDPAAAFAVYRQSADVLVTCGQNVVLRNANGDILERPVTGGQAYLTLTPNLTNVLYLTVNELAALDSLTFCNKPTSTQPLLVNVIGGDFDGNIPNLAGTGGADAPYILWNFGASTSVHVTSGATLEGTIFAPNANVVWDAAQNIEGNVVASTFSHAGGGGSEVHDFPFDTDLSCETPPTPTPTPTDTTTPTDTPTPTDSPTEPGPTDSPTESPTDSPTDSPTESPTGTPEPGPTDSASASGSVSPSESTSAPAPTASSSTPSSGGVLPNTGGPPRWLWWTGLTVMVVGAALMLVNRRNEGEHSA